jgi:UDP-N-acetylmuramate-alanine ligase
LAEADEVWIGPIHRADKIPEAERLDREQLAGDLRAAGKGAYAADVEAIAAGVVNTLAPGDVVVVCSNGAFGGLYGMLRAALAPGAS